MEEKHLRPDEIELLLDEEEGFGTAALRAHVRSCSSCQAEHERSRKLMVALDALPDFAPSPGFTNRVMNEVRVFEPWHVAVLDTARSMIPTSRRARIAASIGAVAGLSLGTTLATWLLARVDIAFLLAQIGLERVQGQISHVIADVAASLLGERGVAIAQSGSPETIAIMAGGFAAAVGLSVVGLHFMASRSSPDRMDAISFGAAD